MRIESTLQKDWAKLVSDVHSLVGEAPKATAAKADAFVGQASSGSVSLDVPGQQRLSGVHQTLFGIGDDPRKKLIDGTQDLRNQANSVSTLTAKLRGMQPTDPGYAQVKQQLDAATAALAKYGYTPTSVPAPGTLWVDPEFESKSLPDDQVTASQFPVGQPVLTPPSPEDALFGDGKLYHLTDPSGATTTITSSLTRYESQISKNRKAAGMSVTDGKPVGVQVNFMGGGGKGKRYGSALQEMARLGVVPTSVAGTSAGSIAAALVAGGADPAEIQRFVTDPALSKLMDVHVPAGGLASGQAAYDLINQELAKLTGITDRPVTFADLKMPLQVVATKMSDSDPSPGTTDLTQAKNRIFVFSQQTTPNTPVALAVRASMAIPGVFDPVQMIDPMSGREVKLVDGGVLDNLPMSESPNFGLPVVGLGLAERDDNNPDATRAAPKKLHGGNLNVGNVFLNAYYGEQMNKAAAASTGDYFDRADPKPGQFMLTLPTWDLTDPSKRDTTLGFGYDSGTDPTLDAQTQQVTRAFFQGVLGQLEDPKAKATNIPSSIPKDFTFSVPVNLKEGNCVASYAGGDSVTFTKPDGSTFSKNLGHDKIEAMYADQLAFGDLASQLAFEVDGSVLAKTGNGLPF